MTEAPPSTTMKETSADVSGPLSKRFADLSPRIQRGGFGRSRFVAAMKYILPGLAMLLLVVVIAWPEFASDDNRFRIPEAVGPIGTSRPQVLNARVLGVDSKSRPFQITAETSALKNEGGREFYRLEQPKADIVLEDGTWVALTAVDGEYEEETKYLYLVGNVNVFHDAGHEFSTPKARFNLNDRSASGDDPVEGQGPLGTLKSEGFRIFEGGERVLFTGKSQMLVYRSARENQ
ncbi:MAG: LPS export ABC transporter periplasmic protein LptC [Alphaproteobacteria bacterium]|nr:LPS export ABC transporter periplasmic protein LptC [Alphaproteobacteria bacterium]